MKCNSRLLAIARKEVRQLSRDRLSFGMIVGIPLMQIILFGFAINTDVRHLIAGVADQAGTELSRQLVSQVRASQVVEPVRTASNSKELLEMLRRGDISVGIFIPPDFERRIQQSDRAAAQLLVDGSDPMILGAARQLSQMQLGQDTTPKMDGPGKLFEIYNPYNPERRSAVHIVPGLIGVILTMTMVMFTAMAIVRERERGNLELLINTPVRNSELMVGKILPYIFIGLVQVTLILLLGYVLFDVPVQGSLVDVYIASLVFIASNLALGLVISTVAQSQFQSMQITFFFFLPSILLSGFMFPFDGMPQVAQYIAELLPLTHFTRLIQGIVSRGTSIGDLMPEIYALIAFAGITLVMATMRFHKRLD